MRSYPGPKGLSNALNQNLIFNRFHFPEYQSKVLAMEDFHSIFMLKGYYQIIPIKSVVACFLIGMILQPISIPEERLNVICLV